MIVDEYKAIFVHVRKTGGTSIRSCFRNMQKVKEHAFATELEDAEPGKFKNYFKFAFVRNPYDWLVSFYHYCIPRHYIPEWSFKQFVHALDSGELFKFRRSCERSTVPQLRMLTIDGKIAVDFVGRFERLQQDFDHVCKTIGRPLIKLPVKQKTEHRHYREYYDNNIKDIVARRYACDFEAFNYAY